jgi:hypothetical protein
MFSVAKDFGRVRTGPELMWESLPEEDFYGEGAHSAESERSNFGVTGPHAGWTSADAVGAKFFYAAGYDVPENTVVSFDEEILKAEKDLVCAGPSETRVAMTANGIEHFLRSVGRTKDGQLRAISSSFASTARSSKTSELP